jgi:molecular chaperone DnaJ
MNNPYETLGVAKDASDEDIKKAFHKLALQHHPDRNPDNKEAEERFKDISAAYETINTPEKRQTYDMGGRVGSNPFSGGFDPFDFIRNASAGGNFNGWFGGRGGRQTRGDDIQRTIQIDFMDSVLGATKKISVDYPLSCAACKGIGAKDGTALDVCKTCNGQGKMGQSHGFMQIISTCPACKGKGKTIITPCAECTNGIKIQVEALKVTIPAGIDNGTMLRLSGKGMPSQYGFDSGDMFLQIDIAPHQRFQRDGFSIFTTESISYLDAILGTKISVETIHGPVKLTVPPGTQPGSILNIKEKGIIKSEGIKGDHLAGIKVNIPAQLKPEELELLARLKELTKEVKLD